MTEMFYFLIQRLFNYYNHYSQNILFGTEEKCIQRRIKHKFIFIILYLMLEQCAEPSS